MLPLAVSPNQAFHSALCHRLRSIIISIHFQNQLEEANDKDEKKERRGRTEEMRRRRREASRSRWFFGIKAIAGRRSRRGRPTAVP
jgi:hypothetical protein